VCLPADCDVARGTYNIQQVQLAFAHAYHVLCNAVHNDDAGHCRKNSTVKHFLCSDSILSSIVCMPHQRDLMSDLRDDSKRRKATSSERKTMHKKRTAPHKIHKHSVAR